MTATDELRRMLDGRGVEWRRTPHYSSESQDNETVFEGTGIEWYANDHLNGRLGLRTARYEVTPEQAVEATLGAGTCHDVGDPSDFCCSECGVRMFTDTNDTYTMIASDGRTIIKHPNYCPNCGRKVRA